VTWLVKSPHIATALLCVPLLSACAGLELTFRDANDIVSDVIDLTADTVELPETERFYALEAQVVSACQPFFESANHQMVHGDVPLHMQLAILAHATSCRDTVDQARKEIDRLTARQNAEPARQAPADQVTAGARVVPASFTSQ
jgi:hypothetical protein